MFSLVEVRGSFMELGLLVHVSITRNGPTKGNLGNHLRAKTNPCHRLGASAWPPKPPDIVQFSWGSIRVWVSSHHLHRSVQTAKREVWTSQTWTRKGRLAYHVSLQHFFLEHWLKSETMSDFIIFEMILALAWLTVSCRSLLQNGVNPCCLFLFCELLSLGVSLCNNLHTKPLITPASDLFDLRENAC